MTEGWGASQSCGHSFYSYNNKLLHNIWKNPIGTGYPHGRHLETFTQGSYCITGQRTFCIRNTSSNNRETPSPTLVQDVNPT